MFTIETGQDFWEMLSALGTCLGAFATFIAVFYTLSESRKNSLPKARVEASLDADVYDYVSFLKDGSGANYYMVLTIANIGYRKLSVKKFTIDRPGYETEEIPIDDAADESKMEIVHNMPYRSLDQGEEITRTLQLGIGKVGESFPGRKRTVTNIARKIIGSPYRIMVVDTAGARYKATIDPDLQKALVRFQSDFDEVIWGKSESSEGSC